MTTIAIADSPVTRSTATRNVPSAPATHAARLASTPEEVRAAQRLRFEVFNLELNEGLDRSFITGLDADPLDEVCDHLLIEHLPTNRVVGTYRLLTGSLAAVHQGYYSAQEFDMSPYEPIRGELVELGRACVHREHRNAGVLNLLWRAIASYAVQRKARYLIGCSSLTSQDAAVGAAAYRQMEANLVEARWQTRPQPGFELPAAIAADGGDPVNAGSAAPRLLRAYLAIGAKICGPPALDREFKTIDFLTFLDLQALPPAVRDRFLPRSAACPQESLEPAR